MQTKNKECTDERDRGCGEKEDETWRKSENDAL